MNFSAKLTRQTAKTSPSRNRTPTKKSSSKMLDPSSRLKPPATLNETRNSEINLSIGLQQQQLEDENEILSISQIHDIPKIEML